VVSFFFHPGNKILTITQEFLQKFKPGAVQEPQQVSVPLVNEPLTNNFLPPENNIGEPTTRAIE